MSGITSNSQGGQEAYNSSKAAVISLTRLLANDFKHQNIRVRVNSIARKSWTASQLVPSRSLPCAMLISVSFNSGILPKRDDAGLQRLGKQVSSTYPTELSKSGTLANPTNFRQISMGRRGRRVWREDGCTRRPTRKRCRHGAVSLVPGLQPVLQRADHRLRWWLAA